MFQTRENKQCKVSDYTWTLAKAYEDRQRRQESEMNSSHPDAAVKSGSAVSAPYAYDDSAAEAAAYEERAKYEESKMPQGSGGVGISEAIKLAKAVEKNFTTHQLGKAIFFVPCILYCKLTEFAKFCSLAKFC